VQKCAKIANFGFYGLHYGKTVEDIWVHAARPLTSIEFSFDPCNIYRDSPRGVGYPADARSVGDSHPSSFLSLHFLRRRRTDIPETFPHDMA